MLSKREINRTEIETDRIRATILTIMTIIDDRCSLVFNRFCLYLCFVYEP